MSDLSDAFIAIPGGFGTLEELLEIVTWNQIGLIVKPVGVLNVCGYFDHLLKFFDHAVQEVSQNINSCMCLCLYPCLWSDLIISTLNLVADRSSLFALSLSKCDHHCCVSLNGDLNTQSRSSLHQP